jgi:TolA-binding protein
MKKLLIASITGFGLMAGYAAAQSMPMGNMDDHIKQMKEASPEQIKAMQEQMQKMHANGSMPMQGQMMQGRMKQMSPDQMKAMQEQMQKMHAENGNIPMMQNMQAHMEFMSKQK